MRTFFSLSVLFLLFSSSVFSFAVSEPGDSLSSGTTNISLNRIQQTKVYPFPAFNFFSNAQSPLSLSSGIKNTPPRAIAFNKTTSVSHNNNTLLAPGDSTPSSQPKLNTPQNRVDWSKRHPVSLFSFGKKNTKKTHPISFTASDEKESSPSEESSTSKTHYKRWTKLKYSGYIRSYTQYRHMPVGYANIPQNLFTLQGLDYNSMGITWTGYQNPLFLLRLEGAPTSKTMFKVEYAFDNQMMGILRQNTSALGNGPSATTNRRFQVYRVFNFTGKANTKLGNFTLYSGGGVIWWRLSPFTYWNYQWRDRMFERYPWEPEGSSWNRYNKHYADQNIARDARWGNAGTQGFVLEGNGLPGGFGFNLIYGKTNNSGGFQTYLQRTPKDVIAGRVDKTFGKHKIGINYFNQFGATDSYAHNIYVNDTLPTEGITAVPDATHKTYLATSMFGVRQQILTMDGKFNFRGLRIYTELGIGRYQDSLIQGFTGAADTVNAILANRLNMPKSGQYYVGGLDYNWGQAINVQIDFDKSLIGFPFSIQYYNVNKSVVNVNSAAKNSANPHAIANLSNVGTANDVTTYRNLITDINNAQMTNNRQSFRIRHEDTYGKLKVIAALGMEQELQNLFNAVTFLHEINDFTRSRFGYYLNNVGPYGRVINWFRRSYETIHITDINPTYKKGYNTLMVHLKYKFMLFNKEVIVTNYTNFSSCQDHFSPVPVFSNKAFVRTFTNEFMAFMAIHPKVTLLGLTGVERNLGNMRTELVNPKTGLLLKNPDGSYKYDPNGKPMDQVGYSYGIGADIDLSDRAGLYLRQRWFYFQDINQFLDRFYGTETSVELKIFF